jgi:hypothetical protein
MLVDALGPDERVFHQYNFPHKDLDMLDAAFEALKKYDWGTDRAPLAPIEAAVISTHDDAAARQELEKRLADALKEDLSRDGKDYVCRKLMVVGTALSTPVLAELLVYNDNSHMARFALERIPAPEAAQALRDALGKVSGALKVGVIGSIGARRDAAAVPALAALLKDSDAATAKAAATALGNIGTPDAAKALQEASPADATKQAVIDGQLVCAETLLAANNKLAALAIYKSLVGDQNKLVKLAATRGMLACAGKKD